MRQLKRNRDELLRVINLLCIGTARMDKNTDEAVAHMQAELDKDQELEHYIAVTTKLSDELQNLDALQQPAGGVVLGAAGQGGDPAVGTPPGGGTVGDREEEAVAAGQDGVEQDIASLPEGIITTPSLCTARRRRSWRKRARPSL